MRASQGRKMARNHTPRAQERNSENVQNGAGIGQKTRFQGEKSAKTNGGEIRVTLILRHVNDSFPTARKMRKIRLFTSLTGGDGGCARDAGKGRGRNASDAVVFMILKAAQAFLRGRAEVLR